ncbi:MAG: enoyl-CoA hydratase/isomerase family protein, partial [Thermodesulfobacteriota bacterium]
MHETIKEEKEGFITTIIINRPEKFNALTPSMITELEERFKKIQDAPDVRAVVLSGAGSNFCAGVDVKGTSYNPVNSRLFLKKFNSMLKTIEMMPQPTIAMINGNAV